MIRIDKTRTSYSQSRNNNLQWIKLKIREEVGGKNFRHVGGYLLHQIWIPRDLDPRDPREKAAAAPPDGNGAH